MADRYRRVLNQFVADEVGGPAVEYSLVAALIAMTILVGFITMTDRVQGTYDLISNSMQ